MPKSCLSHSVTIVPSLICLIAFLSAWQPAFAGSPLCTSNASPAALPSADEPLEISIQSIVVNKEKSDSASAADIELLRAGSSVPEATVAVGTKLMKGDRICTREDDQVVLEVSYGAEETKDLVFLDPNSEVEVGSICTTRGSFLAWAARKVGWCTTYGTLAVGGTEFEVIIKPDRLEVVVYEGEVTFLPKDVQVNLFDPRSNRGAIVRAAHLVPEITKISRQSAFTVTSSGTEQIVEVPEPELRERIDRWSRQIVKTSQPSGPIEKAFSKNEDQAQRADTFMQARREALLNKSEQGYLDMAQALNDWNNGEAAEKSLSEVKNLEVRSSAKFMVNEAEAQRLQGNLAKASAILDQTIAKHEGYGPAKLLKGQILLESIPPGTEDPVVAEKAKDYFAGAVTDGSGKDLINIKVANNYIDRTIQTLGRAAIQKGDDYASAQKVFGRTDTDLVQYRGTTSLTVGDERITGRAVLSIYGDQFKLATGDKILTGRIVATRHAGGISAALDFDSPNVLDAGRENVVISVVGSQFRNQIVLRSLANESESFVFRSTGSIIQR